MKSRILGIKFFVIITISVLSMRLFSIQIMDTDYQEIANRNVIQKGIEYPYRGLIFDRNGKLLLYNDPVFDLMITPKNVDLSDSLLIKKLLFITQREFDQAYLKAISFSRHLPSIFYKQLSNEKFAAFQDRMKDLEGFNINSRTTRGYAEIGLANILGYVGEVTQNQLNMDTTGYYKSGDNIGITGIEKTYERSIRGLRGVKYRNVDVQGVNMGSFENGAYDTLPQPGQNLVLTIDGALQKYAERLMEGKIGSLVAIDPSSGEILALVSAPSYDPSLLSGRGFSQNFGTIQRDSLKPLFNRPLQAMYPPGSMFKTIQALIALQQDQVQADEIITVNGKIIGDHAPLGKYDMQRAITKSSNNYFFKVFRRVIQQGEHLSPFIDSRMGYNKWRDYVLQFGFGKILDIDLPNEKAGFVPSLEFYDQIYGEERWKFSNIYSLSIGQGELLVTPLQMANLGVILANRGYYFTPHLVRKVGAERLDFSQKNSIEIDTGHFESILEGMQALVSVPGSRAYIPGLVFCGKTSTVENPQGLDHSGFMGFAPRNNPKIAIAVYVENAGWGARAALSTASLAIEKYLNGSVKKKWLENYVLKGDFQDAKPE
ncbi:MAG: penicillin-binding transpeptidase domain-containing protein [Cyclobacteriaceae bacterium]|nr:penicillin-binding transpeptidase domain-containing protein [Cyclobacteriaceae bacterium]